MKCFGKLTLWIACMTVPASLAWAGWPSDPSTNVPVDTLAYAGVPSITSDGAGGTIVVWYGHRNSLTVLLAQRLDASGQFLWSPDGVPVAPTGVLGYANPQVTADGAGGAIVAWAAVEGSIGDVYAQRINSIGELQWGGAGVPVCMAVGIQSGVVLTSDDAGGAIVAWYDRRAPISPGIPQDVQVYAQRISANGVPLWLTDGIAASAGAGEQAPQQIIPDGAGGAILVWHGGRRSTVDQLEDVYAQRLSATGAPLWGANGVAVCSALGAQTYPKVASDGAGGAFVAWADKRSGAPGEDQFDAYAQHLDATGVPLWTPDGAAICALPGSQFVHRLMPDGAGGVFMVWMDKRSGVYHVYAQRLDGAGAAQWTTNGTLLSDVEHAQTGAHLVPDGAGGAFVLWTDYESSDPKIYAQRVSANGSQLWGAGGLALSTAGGEKYSPDFASDGVTGAVAVWQVRRGESVHLYAQGVQANGLGPGSLAGATPNANEELALAPVGANPSRGGGMWVRFTLRGGATGTIDVVDVTGRRVLSRRLDSFGPGTHTLDLLSGRRLAPGVYLVSLREGDRMGVTRMTRLD